MKTVCILGYKFYGYEKEIVEELKKKYKIIFIDYDLNLFETLISKFFKKNRVYLINKKIKKQLKIKDIYILLSISWKEIYFGNMKFLEKEYNIKKKILYLWDNIIRVPNFFEIKQFFDKVYTFDFADSKKYNLRYRATFYSKRLEELKIKDINFLKKIDIFFIGIYRKNRLEILKNLYKNKENFIYLYYSRIFYYIYRFIGKKDFKNIRDYINFSPITREKYNEIFMQSKYIIDIPEENQTGFTQRVLDAIFLEKKVITTQKNIFEESIYNPNNILIIEKYEDIEKNEDFFKKNYEKISKDKIEYYSISYWANEILED